MQQLHLAAVVRLGDLLLLSVSFGKFRCAGITGRGSGRRRRTPGPGSTHDRGVLTANELSELHGRKTFVIVAPPARTMRRDALNGTKFTRSQHTGPACAGFSQIVPGDTTPRPGSTAPRTMIM